MTNGFESPYITYLFEIFTSQKECQIISEKTQFNKYIFLIFMFAPCSNDNQTLYYPTNAQYITCRYNYNYKIFKSAPTCFGSQRIHQQGALYSAWLPDDGSSVIRNKVEQF